MAKNKKDDSFDPKKLNFQTEIPERLLKELAEYKNGGYILFSFDENGGFKLSQEFDSDKDCFALWKFAKEASDAIDTLHSGNVFESFLGDPDDEPPTEGDNNQE